MLSAKGDKAEAKFATRLDVLVERVDTLASTIATTASAMAKHDGEIAALRKELEARDQRLTSLVTQPREAAAGNELRELKEAVARLASERAKDRGPGKGLDDLTAKVTLLAQRLETVSATVSTTAAGLAGRDGELAAIRKRLESAPASAVSVGTDPALAQRVGALAADVTGTRVQLQDLADEIAALRALAEQADADAQPSADEVGALTAGLSDTRQRVAVLAQDIAALRASSEQHAADSARPSEEIREMLGALRTKVEQLGELRMGAAEELDERLAQTDERVAHLAGRVDTLATAIDSALAGIGEKEAELGELHGQFTASSGRIEAIVDDIRAALSAFPEPGAIDVDDLSVRFERIESASREHADTNARLASELSRRIEAIEAQLATVASEMARAKTLWPVALRSLEARLDDVASHAHPPEPASEEAERTETRADEDLLAGLRDSLQAMETVAAEMARASDVLAPSDEQAETGEAGAFELARASAPSEEPVVATPHEAVAAAGATIVPLRSADP